MNKTKRTPERDARLYPPRYTLQLAQEARALLKIRGRHTAGRTKRGLA